MPSAIPSYRVSLADLRDDRPVLCITLDDLMREVREGATLDPERTLPPDEAVEYYATAIADRVRNEGDAIVVITGPRGRGKSTLALRLAKRISELLGRPFKVAESLIYSAVDLGLYFVKLTEEEDRGAIAIIDEGGRVLFNRDFNTVESKAIVKMLTQIRDAGGVMMICLPNLRSLDVAIRGDLAAYWFAVRKKGLARCHFRDNRLAYKPETSYGFSTNTRVPHMIWKKYPTSSKLYATYLTTKRTAMRTAARQTLGAIVGAKAERHGKPSHPPTADETNERLKEKRRLKAANQKRFRWARRRRVGGSLH